MRTPPLRWIPFLTVLLALGAAGAGHAQDPDGVRRELLRMINEERAKERVPLLRLVDALNDTAQQHADELGRAGTLRLPRGSEEAMGERLEKLGYQVHAWTESVTATTGDLASVLRAWKSQDNGTWKSLLDDDYRDLGIGVSKMRGAPLYSFLFAVPEGEFFIRATGPLRDVGRVRAAVLAEVNARRRKAGAPALRSSPALDKAAQGHAEDMLARGYFAHESPNGNSASQTVRERAREAGFDWRAIGENIAEGQFSVAQVMEGWMNSPEHRRNILDPVYTELGIGLVTAKGKDGRYRVIWVQNFGTPKK
jgi:uncharacterized protein YkwD